MTTPSDIPVTIVIRGMIDGLNPAQRLVAQCVLDDPGGSAALTISELAHHCGTSDATVTRFCRSLGLRGYPQLRLALATEAGTNQARGGDVDLGGDIHPEDPLSVLVEKITSADARAVNDTAKSLSLATLDAVVNAIVDARRIDLYGVGASGFVAFDLQLKLHRIGRVVSAWADPHLALTSAALLVPGDVAIGISHTGTTIDTVDALAQAAERGATAVALTNSSHSPLAHVARHVLTTAAREATFRSGATASRLAQLTVIDCLFAAVAQRTFDASLRALAVTSEAVRTRRR